MSDLATLTEVFHRVLKSRDIVLTPSLTAADVPSWDSVNHVNLMIEIEETFGVRFSTREITGLKNVGGLVDLLRIKGAKVAWS